MSDLINYIKLIATYSGKNNTIDESISEKSYTTNRL